MEEETHIKSPWHSNSQTYMYTFKHIYVHTQRHKIEGGDPGSHKAITFYIRYRHNHTQYDIWDICQHTTNIANK